jgi:hypothetical protein
LLCSTGVIVIDSSTPIKGCFLGPSVGQSNPYLKIMD